MRGKLVKRRLLLFMLYTQGSININYKARFLSMSTNQNKGQNVAIFNADTV